MRSPQAPSLGEPPPLDTLAEQLTAEQRHLDHARDCLDAMRERTAAAVADAEAVVRMGGGADADIVLQHL